MIRYFGISRLSTSASTTSALCPAEPTAEVPHGISFTCDCAGAAAAIARPVTSKTSVRLNMTDSSVVDWEDSVDPPAGIVLQEPETQKDEPGRLRNLISAGVDRRPRALLRWGKRPKRSMNSRWRRA